MPTITPHKTERRRLMAEVQNDWSEPMEKVPHTAIPWQASGEKVRATAAGHEGDIIADFCRGGWSRDECEANAAFAVHAVNCHDDLLEACKAMTEREFSGHNATCLCCRQTRARGHAADCQWVKAVAIITKAEGRDP